MLIQGWYEKHKEKWWFKLIGLLSIVAFTAFLTNKILPPKIPKPDIEIIYEYVSTRPYKSDSSGDLHLDYQADENISGLRIFIHNQGDTAIGELIAHFIISTILSHGTCLALNFLMDFLFIIISIVCTIKLFI